MLNGIFKEVYQGHGIYWFGVHGYGDETNPMYDTIGEMRQAIDAKLAKQAAEIPAHERYWATLTDSQKRWWRQNMNWDSELSVSEQAYKS